MSTSNKSTTIIIPSTNIALEAGRPKINNVNNHFNEVSGWSDERKTIFAGISPINGVIIYGLIIDGGDLRICYNERSTNETRKMSRGRVAHTYRIKDLVKFITLLDVCIPDTNLSSADEWEEYIKCNRYTTRRNIAEILKTKLIELDLMIYINN